jgi:N-acetylglucosaminyldiphosphoundecaprenol N-acetyl-beta-D-mannosaminyltransferase
VRVDSVDLDGALDFIDALVAAGRGGVVFTPNVDHVILAHEDPRMRAAYSKVDLSVADGMPLVWASRLLRPPLPQRVAGSDLVPHLLERAAERRWRVYFLGGAPGVAALARDTVLKQIPDLEIVGIDAPRFSPDEPMSAQQAVVERIRAARPHVVFVAFGAPKQEIWIDRFREQVAPAVLLGVGATLDFLAGSIPRAPRWMAESGLEWLFRLSREPRRLWRRYLLRDPKFLLVLGREIGMRVRARERTPGAP